MSERSQTSDKAAPAPTPASTRAAGALLQRKCACGGSAGLSGECEDCGGKSLVQRRASGGAPAAVPSVVHEVIGSSGQPLDAVTRAFMEPRFGHDFSRVPVHSSRPQSASESLVIGAANDQYEREADASASRAAATTGTSADRRADFGGIRVHTDPRAAASAAAIGARAYTVGSHIVFGAGQYAPQTSEGKALLAHELTHTLQQNGPARGALQRTPDKEKGKPEEKPAATKFPGCDTDRQAKIEEAIKHAEALASRAVAAFERYLPLSYEATAMKAHFGSLSTDQTSTIVARYKDIETSLASKTFTCAKKGKKAKEGKEIVDLCGQAPCTGSTITLFPDFGTTACPPGPVILHEAAHNAGACDDIDKGGSYPPTSPENNAYSYEYFAVDVAAGVKAPPTLKKHVPKAPK